MTDIGMQELKEALAFAAESTCSPECSSDVERSESAWVIWHDTGKYRDSLSFSQDAVPTDALDQVANLVYVRHTGEVAENRRAELKADGWDRVPLYRDGWAGIKEITPIKGLKKDATLHIYRFDNDEWFFKVTED